MVATPSWHTPRRTRPSAASWSPTHNDEIIKASSGLRTLEQMLDEISLRSPVCQSGVVLIARVLRGAFRKSEGRVAVCRPVLRLDRAGRNPVTSVTVPPPSGRMPAGSRCSSRSRHRAGTPPAPGHQREPHERRSPEILIGDSPRSRSVGARVSQHEQYRHDRCPAPAPVPRRVEFIFVPPAPKPCITPDAGCTSNWRMASSPGWPPPAAPRSDEVGRSPRRRRHAGLEPGDVQERRARRPGGRGSTGRRVLPSISSVTVEAGPRGSPR